MSVKSKEEIEHQLLQFASKNFEKPSKCKNLMQVQYYIQELCDRIREVESKFNYAPSALYGLLAQYNQRQQTFMSERYFAEFRIS